MPSLSFPPFPLRLSVSVRSSAVASVSFRFRSCACLDCFSVSVSVSVLLAARTARKRHRLPHETKQPHGVRLRRFGATRDEGGGVGVSAHFVHSEHLGAYCPHSPLRTFIPLRGNGVLSCCSLPWSFRSLRAGKGISVRSKGEWGAFLRKEMSFLSGKKCTFGEGSFIREKG